MSEERRGRGGREEGREEGREGGRRAEEGREWVALEEDRITLMTVVLIHVSNQADTHSTGWLGGCRSGGGPGRAPARDPGGQRAATHSYR